MKMTPRELWTKIMLSFDAEGKESDRVICTTKGLTDDQVGHLRSRLRYLKWQHWKRDMMLPIGVTLSTTWSKKDRRVTFQLIPKGSNRVQKSNDIKVELIDG